MTSSEMIATMAHIHTKVLGTNGSVVVPLAQAATGSNVCESAPIAVRNRYANYQFEGRWLVI